MTARSLEGRIVKLEASRRRPNELLVVWRRAGGDVKAAVAEAKFAPGDRVICLEWFGDGPLPAPRWHDKGLNFSGVEDPTRAGATRALFLFVCLRAVGRRRR